MPFFLKEGKQNSNSWHLHEKWLTVCDPSMFARLTRTEAGLGGQETLAAAPRRRTSYCLKEQTRRWRWNILENAPVMLHFWHFQKGRMSKASFHHVPKREVTLFLQRAIIHVLLLCITSQWKKMYLFCFFIYALFS